jgi:hypothetical protein
VRSFLRNLCDLVGRGQPEVVAERFAAGSSCQSRASDKAVTVVFRTAAEARTSRFCRVGFFRVYFDDNCAARDHAG